MGRKIRKILSPDQPTMVSMIFSFINNLQNKPSARHIPSIFYLEIKIFPFPFLRLAYAPIVETRFPELVVSLLDFSPWIPLGTFSSLLLYKVYVTDGGEQAGLPTNSNPRRKHSFPVSEYTETSLSDDGVDLTKYEALLQEVIHSTLVDNHSIDIHTI